MERSLLKLRFLVLAGCLALWTAGCRSSGRTAVLVNQRPGLLRVGVTPDAPPVIYKQNGEIAGLEADLARALGQELGREVQFIELPWNDQMAALTEGRTDIVMSGMSVTQTRRSDVAFTDPYMAGGLMALVREEDADEFAGPFAFVTTAKRVAVQTETTGDYFAQKYMKEARRSAYDTVTEAFHALQAGKADMMIHDAPVVWHLAARDSSSGIVVARPRLTVEYYAWAIHPGRGRLLDEVNAVLDRWKANGTLQRTVQRWVPLAE